LETLNLHHAKATFFCVGENAAKNPSVLQAIKLSGHTIGNHTYNHLKGWQTADFTYIRNTLNAIPVTSGNLFRPPYGRITKKQGLLLRSKGFRIIMWSLLSCDYLKTLNKQKALDALIKHSKPGSIVVFHDSSKARVNLEWLLPRYMEAMKQKGMKFAAL
jgi:peptidoglycan-N-acetylglucosamine deacetylase